jgi:hypothetical protein
MSRQYYRPQSFLAGKPLGGGDQRLEHRGIKRIHLIGALQAHIGDTVRHRDRDALLHESSLPALLYCCRFTESRSADLVNQPINRQSL